MRLRGIIAMIGVAIAGAVLFSCAKEEPAGSIDSSIWTGTFEVQMLNNDTMEMEDHTAGISLEFRKAGRECIVYTGIKGMYSMNRRVFDASWSTKNTFTLSQTNAMETVAYYRGSIKGKKMVLDTLNGGEVVGSMKLEKVDR